MDSGELSNVRMLIHTAAIVRHSRDTPQQMLELNVQGTLQMVRVAQQLKARMVFISSSGTVGCFKFPDVTADEDAPYVEATVGRWPYYLSKVRAEREARALAAKLGVELVVVRLPVLLGPGDHRFRSTGHVLKVLQRHLPGLPRGGMHFCDIRDVATALVRLTTVERPREIYHLPGTATSLATFFQMVSEVSAAPLPSREIPPWLLNGLAKTGAVAGALRGRPLKLLPDPVVAEMSAHYWGLSTLWSHRELAYQTRSARQTLVDTVAWLRRHHPALQLGRAA
jgi:nucleoside-diphosphate-sugar epimerase